MNNKAAMIIDMQMLIKVCFNLKTEVIHDYSLGLSLSSCLDVHSSAHRYYLVCGVERRGTVAGGWKQTFSLVRRFVYL
jgi:hypothetical protein